ncbi:MAG: murein L,D-transpeptidase YcbB/YkuD [Alphaproteobacteria bacterium]|jgi:murein L,D-transpeptidase YcbB/YkuD
MNVLVWIITIVGLAVAGTQARAQQPIAPCQSGDAAIASAYGELVAPPAEQIGQDNDLDGRESCLGPVPGRVALAETGTVCSNSYGAVETGSRFIQGGAVYLTATDALSSKSLVSDDPAHRRLKDALDFYTTLAGSGGWQSIPAGPSLKPGMTHAQVGDVRRRLAVTRDIHTGDLESPVFDADLEAAVRRFQARNGLAVDGVVGRETRATLNVPADIRAAAIAQNLCRYPDLVAKQIGTAIIVNVPGAELRFFRDGELSFSSRVIVGRADWPTPIISDAISAIELNPYWNVPPRIAQLEVIPRIVKDIGYLKSQGIRVLSVGDAPLRELDPAQIDWNSVGDGSLPFRLRQDPGPKNAMGLVKFRLGNPYHIFLHDTPGRHLFENAKRSLSHGCVRVQGALELAKLILETRSDMPSNGLKQALDDGAPVTIRLREPVPVHLVVISAWVDADGSVHFRNDPTRDLAEKSCIGSLKTVAGNICSGPQCDD